MNDNVYLASVFEEIIKKCQAAVTFGDIFYPKTKTWLQQKELARAEFAIGCRYMHRGVYCPSPDIECIITNMRRGRIAKRPTKSTKPTNFYMFDRGDKLYFVETYYPNGSTQTEYVVHDDNIAYGFVYDKGGAIEQISIEEFCQDRRCSYTFAERMCGEIFYLMHETVSYPESNKVETDIITAQKSLGGMHLNRWRARYDLDVYGDIILISRELLFFTEETICGNTFS